MYFIGNGQETVKSKSDGETPRFEDFSTSFREKPFIHNPGTLHIPVSFEPVHTFFLLIWKSFFIYLFRSIHHAGPPPSHAQISEFKVRGSKYGSLRIIRAVLDYG